MNGPLNKKAGRDYARQALLPGGFRDQLFPAAEYEFSAVRKLLGNFTRYGYDRVSPPLVEYEDSLLAGPGGTRANQMFRLMDTDTQQVMAIRADMTVQMSRLAATRLQNAPRPLRLAYAGNVLRVKGSQLRPTRQFMQVGFELIGCETLDAELEVITLTLESLRETGIDGLSLDLTIAPLIGALIAEYGLGDTDRLQTLEALAVKDVHGFGHLDGRAEAAFSALIAATGPAETALSRLESVSLPPSAAPLVARLGALVGMLRDRLPGLAITIDPSETHGFEYKTGIGFAVFAKGSTTELGRGGRYHVDHPGGMREEATGFSVYMDTLMAALPVPAPAEKVYVARNTAEDEIKSLHGEGWRTIQGLTDAADSSKEARRLGCSHVYTDGEVNPVL